MFSQTFCPLELQPLHEFAVSRNSFEQVQQMNTREIKGNFLILPISSSLPHTCIKWQMLDIQHS